MTIAYTPKKTLAWGTDLHLDHLTPQDRQAFYDALAAIKLDGFLLGGDLAVAHEVEPFLMELHATVSIPI